jgi:hypothetical protein
MKQAPVTKWRLMGGGEKTEGFEAAFEPGQA